MNKFFRFNIFILASFAILSCSERKQDNQSVSARDSTQVGSFKSEFDTEKNSVENKTRFTYAQKQGKHIYMKYCSVCHGSEGKGDGFNSYNLNPHPRDLTDINYMSALSDEHLVETITEGGRGANKSPLMPSWGNTIKQDDILRIVSYIRNFSTNNID